MRKLLCIVLVLCLVLAPLAVYADYDENPVQRWAFGMGGEPIDVQGQDGWSFSFATLEGGPLIVDFVDGNWVPVQDGALSGSINNVTGEVESGMFEYDGNYYMISPGFTWLVPYTGAYMITGSVIGENADVTVLIADGWDIYPVSIQEVGEGHAAEFYYYEFLFAGELLIFMVIPIDENEIAVSNWNLVLHLLADEDSDEDEAYPAEEYADEAYPEEEYVEEDTAEEDYPAAEELPAEEEAYEPAPAAAACQLYDVPVRVVDGVEYVGFRAAATACGVLHEELVWYGPTQTVTVLAGEKVVGEFAINTVGGFNDNGTVYVPLAFVLQFFE